MSVQQEFTSDCSPLEPSQVQSLDEEQYHVQLTYTIYTLPTLYSLFSNDAFVHNILGNIQYPLAKRKSILFLYDFLLEFLTIL